MKVVRTLSSEQPNEREPLTRFIARTELGIDDVLQGHSACNANGRPKIRSNNRIRMMSDERTIARRKKDKTEGFYRSVRCTRENELLVRLPDLNICGSRIRFAHHVKGHFENTEKTFLVL